MKVDQFESMFRAAARDEYAYRRIAIKRVWVVSDRVEAEAQSFADRAKAFLAVLKDDEATWEVIARDASRDIDALVARAEAERPDLICTCRDLHGIVTRQPYGLGTHLDGLTQRTHTPILVLPHPERDAETSHAFRDTNVVMAVTDHLSGDGELVNYAVRFVESDGAVWLTHVEDEPTFDRYMAAIAKIPQIDTDEARDVLQSQLLKDPTAYIEQCRAVLREVGVAVRVEALVTFGRYLKEYKRLIESHRVDLLMMHTKDADQLAMRGIAYELAVELRHIPLMLI